MRRFSFISFLVLAALILSSCTGDTVGNENLIIERIALSGSKTDEMIAYYTSDNSGYVHGNTDKNDEYVSYLSYISSRVMPESLLGNLVYSELGVVGKVVKNTRRMFTPI